MLKTASPSALLKRSWERSVVHGVDSSIAKDAILEAAVFKQYREQSAALLRELYPTIESLACWLKDSYSIVAVCDPSGFILESVGDPLFLKDTEKIQVQNGACWSEQVRGTNSAGTVIIEKVPLAVVGNEHFLKSNHSIYCAASPIFDKSGHLLAVLDISGSAERYHPSLLGIVDLAARTFEDWLLIRKAERQTIISLTPEQTGKHRLLLALDEDGVITGANREARAHFHLDNTSLGQVQLANLLSDVEPLLKRHMGAPAAEKTFHLHSVGTDSPWLASVLIDSRPYVSPAATTTSNLYAKAPGQTKPFSISRYTFDDIYGTDEAFLSSVRLAKRAAATEYTVNITGESGTGKDIISQAIHCASARAKKPFIALNCGAISKSLLESELFGYEAGAFTGAKQTGHPGKIEQAHEGTLFLDEIAELPMEMQVALLRVLQDFTVTRVGGTKSIHVNVRIITATHADLWKKVQEGSFRADLFYRLQGVPIALPPLRERADRLQLARYLLKGIEAELMQSPLWFTPETERLILDYPWPGNVRQLTSALRGAAFLSDCGAIGISCFPDYILADYPRDTQIDTSLKHTGDRVIMEALQMNGGNVSQTARMLGIGRNTVYRRMKRTYGQ